VSVFEQQVIPRHRQVLLVVALHLILHDGIENVGSSGQHRHQIRLELHVHDVVHYRCLLGDDRGFQFPVLVVLKVLQRMVLLDVNRHSFEFEFGLGVFTQLVRLVHQFVILAVYFALLLVVKQLLHEQFP